MQSRFAADIEGQTHQRTSPGRLRRMLIPASVVLTVVGLAAAGIYWKTRPAYLDIRVRPPDAKVILDGESIELEQGKARLMRSPGQVQVGAQVDSQVDTEIDTEADSEPDSEFDLPVPEEIDLEDPDVKQAVREADREARELRTDPDAVESLLPKLSDVKKQIGSLSVRNTLAARDPRVRAEMVEKEGGTILTEAAVARALRWLASQQNDDGGWGLHKSPLKSDEAATSLALLPLLGAGQTHLSGVYKDNVAGGLRWLVDHQRENGDLRHAFFRFGNQGMYAHGLGTIVLCEAFAMEGDEKLRVPAQKAVDFIVEAQHSGGGWRYMPGQRGDTSVTGWQLSALHSARVAGLTTPDSTFALADQFLDSARASNFGRREIPGYAYYRGRRPSRAMTAEALLCRMYHGWTEENPDLQQDVAWLAENHLPEEKKPEMYYWYYGTQVFHQVGGERWEQWNNRMRDILMKMQERSGDDAGSWPTLVNFDRAGGRIYTTSLAACTLEVYYRHLPLFRQIKLD